MGADEFLLLEFVVIEDVNTTNREKLREKYWTYITNPKNQRSFSLMETDSTCRFLK